MALRVFEPKPVPVSLAARRNACREGVGLVRHDCVRATQRCEIVFMYSFKQMREEVRADYRKYADFFRPAPRQGRPCIIRVLLSSPGFFVIAVYRVRFWIRDRCESTPSPFFKLIIVCLLKCLNQLANSYANVVMKTFMPFWPAIGPGLYLSNRGGIIMGAECVGSGCVIHHDVTIGFDGQGRRPRIGDNVWVGPDSVVYGQQVGDGAVVAGSTVVGKSVPGRCLIKGKPGRITQRDFDNSPYLSSPDPYVGAERAESGPPPASIGPVIARRSAEDPASDRYSIQTGLFENMKADLARYRLDTNDASPTGGMRAIRRSRGFRATAVYRLGQWTDTALISPICMPVKCVLLAVHRCLSFIIAKAYGIRIDRRASIGKGFYIGHFGGIVIGLCRVGENCSVHQHVHLEESVVDRLGMGPWIGDNVWIGVHARVRGRVRIGSNATVAAGAVVTQDVPDGCLVAGDPARVVGPAYDNAPLLWGPGGKAQEGPGPGAAAKS